MAARPGITPGHDGLRERLVTAETVRLNVAAAEELRAIPVRQPVLVRSADLECIAGARVAVVGRLDPELIAVRVRAYEFALAKRALGKAGDDGSMNGLTRAVVLQRQMAARGRASWPGNETERRLCSGPACSHDPPAAADPVLARGRAGGAVGLGIDVPGGDV